MLKLWVHWKCSTSIVTHAMHIMSTLCLKRCRFFFFFLAIVLPSQLQLDACYFHVAVEH